MASHMILIGSVDKKKWYLFIYIYLFLKSLLFLRLPLLPLLFNEIHAPHVARSRPRTRSPLSFSRVSFSPQFLRVRVSSSTFYFVKFSIKRKQQQQKKKRRTEPASIAANGAVNWNAARPIKKETEPHLTHLSSSRWNPATNSFAILSFKKRKKETTFLADPFTTNRPPWRLRVCYLIPMRGVCVVMLPFREWGPLRQRPMKRKWGVDGEEKNNG